MKRREFITLLGGAAAWPLAAEAQQAAMPVVGFLQGSSSAATVHMTAGFHRGLKEAGYVEGQNVSIEYRYADGQVDQLPTLAADLVRRRVAVIGAFSPPAAQAAKAATATIPIVFTSNDPVKFGLVSSFNRPGANVTGVNVQSIDLESKRLELLSQLVPASALIAALINPQGEHAEQQSMEVQAGAPRIGREILILHASSERDLESAFMTHDGGRADCLSLRTGVRGVARLGAAAEFNRWENPAGRYHEARQPLSAAAAHQWGKRQSAEIQGDERTRRRASPGR